MATASSPELLVLQRLRILGMAEASAIARGSTLMADAVEDLLLDDEAVDLFQHRAFSDTGGCSLTSAGRMAGGRLLAAELEHSGAGPAVTDAHTASGRSTASSWWR